MGYRTLGILILNVLVCFASINIVFISDDPLFAHFSSDKIKSRVEVIEKIDAEKNEGLSKIIKLTDNIADSKKEIEYLKKEIENLPQIDVSGFSEDWGFHAPSILILLEDSADLNNLRMAIDYNTMRLDYELSTQSESNIAKVVRVNVSVEGSFSDIRNHLRDIEMIELASVEYLDIDASKDKSVANYTVKIYFFE